MKQQAEQSSQNELELKILDRLITNQKQAIRYYVIFAFTLFILGIIMMVTAFWSSEKLIADAFKNLFGIGGAFVSSLSALPVREILNRKERISILQMVKDWLPDLERARNEEGDVMYERILESLIKVIEQTISEK